MDWTKRDDDLLDAWIRHPEQNPAPAGGPARIAWEEGDTETVTMRQVDFDRLMTANHNLAAEGRELAASLAAARWGVRIWRWAAFALAGWAFYLAVRGHR